LWDQTGFYFEQDNEIVTTSSISSTITTSTTTTTTVASSTTTAVTTLRTEGEIEHTTDSAVFVNWRFAVMLQCAMLSWFGTLD